jgi:hypothetical protein
LQKKKLNETKKMAGRETRDYLGAEIRTVSPGEFFYLTALIVLGLALEQAFIVSWQTTGWTAVQYSWANAGVLLGVCLLWFLWRTFMDGTSTRGGLGHGGK